MFNNNLPTEGSVLGVDVGLAEITNHDDRASIVCALTALCVAAGAYTAVGDDDGWIILPPRQFIRSWARAMLESNAEEDVVTGCLIHVDWRT